MASRVRLGRWIRIAGIAILAFIICLFAAVRIQQYVLRWRAERLLADMRQINAGTSTGAEAQRLAARWKKWSSFTSPCTLERCIYWIQLQDPSSIAFNACNYGFCAVLARPLAWFGWHSALVQAEIRVENGVVSDSVFTLIVDVFPQTVGQDNEGYGLVGKAMQSAKFRPFEFRDQRLLHPEYWIGKPGGCEGCIKLVTGHTPLADKAKIDDLTDFNFSCITRWSQCTTEAEIMPIAWKQYQQELPGNRAREEAFERCDVPLEFMGREYQDIAIVQIIASQTLRQPNHIENVAKLRIIRSLKGQTPLSPDKAAYFSIFDRGQGVPGWGSTDLNAGKKYILMGSFGEWNSGGKLLALDDCGVEPFNDQNLAAIQRGINASLVRQ
jgi:hypothetical protein